MRLPSCPTRTTTADRRSDLKAYGVASNIAVVPFEIHD